MKRLLVCTAVAVVASIGLTPNAEAQAQSVRHFSNCTKLNKVYPHGVGKKGAHDHTSGSPVTNFRRSNALYNANRGRDRDGDHIACEKH